MKQIDRDKLTNTFKECYSYNDICVKYYGYTNSKVLTKVRNFAFNNSLDTSHFDGKKYNRKYEIIEKNCPVCQKQFLTKKGHNREKVTCSHKCSNTYFRSGEDNGNWSEDRYTTTCFEYHDKKCMVCGETNIVAVHHYDANHENNKPENLVPMCPTHHQYMHSRFISLIKEKVDNYVIKWKQERKHGKLAESV